MANKKARTLKQDALVESLVPDPANVPGTKLLVGFLGRSTRAGYWRVYLTPMLNSYVELSEEDVVHSQQMADDEINMGTTALWIKKDAELQYTRTEPLTAQAQFLQGAITTGFLEKTGVEGITRARDVLGVHKGPFGSQCVCFTIPGVCATWDAVCSLVWFCSP